MSLILDALRKSEGQRQRHAGPALATVPESGERRGPGPWTLIIGALLVVNAVLLGALFLWPAPEPGAGTVSPASRAPAPAEPAAPPPARTAQRVSLPPPTRAPRQEVRPLSAEVPPPEPAAAATPPAAPATRTTPSNAPPPQAAGSQAGADARLPRVSELVVRGELNVPDMHVDIHVFSGNPAERFVFINMRKYREGDDTREGPRVERITEAGVVMTYDGRRFVLPKD